jgi:hypothetical protein
VSSVAVSNVSEPKTVACTVPVGTVPPAAAEATITVNVSGWPKLAGLALDVTVMVAAA